MTDEQKLNEIYVALMGSGLRGGSGGLIHEFKNMKLQQDLLMKMAEKQQMQIEKLEQAPKGYAGKLIIFISGIAAALLILGLVGLKDIINLFK